MNNTNNTIPNDNSSDSDEYIDVDEIISRDLNNKLDIYQIQLYDNNIIIKNIGKEDYAPDIIIKENFGPNNSYSLYSCIYTEEELFKIDLINNDTFFPIIKLGVKQDEENITTYSIAVKFNNVSVLKEQVEQEITDFNVFLVYNKKNEEKINVQHLDKNINSGNIVETLIVLSSTR